MPQTRNQRPPGQAPLNKAPSWEFNRSVSNGQRHDEASLMGLVSLYQRLGEHALPVNIFLVEM
jgi:hypothetical protein